MTAVRGSIEDVIFFNPENGYSVLALNFQGEMLTVVGIFPELAVGEELEITGEFTHHPRFGQQFKAVSFQRILPVDVVGIERYLASGLIRGIGSHFAGQLVRKFGAQTLEIIDKDPLRLMEIPGIGDHKVQLIVSSWREQKNVYEVMRFLQDIEVTTNLAMKICKQYGAQAVDVVRSDPYRLAQDIHGIGFLTADKIAASQGLPKNHPSRIQAGLVFLLRQYAADGHVYAPRQELEQKAAQMLGLPLAPITQALDRCAEEGRERLSPTALIVEPPLDADDPAEGSGRPAAEIRPAANGLAAEEDRPPAVIAPAGQQRIYLLPYHASETGAAERLAWLIRRGERRSRVSGSTLLLPTLIADEDITTQQAQAVENALRHPVSVMTGGPGTGKSYTIASLITALEALGKKYALAAPTGRAAKRLSEATGRKASTLHRLMAFIPDENEADEMMIFDEPQELDLDMLVVDEASMIDLPLAYRLLKAVPSGCHLLLVGDVDQLPSVGAGNFLHDVIESGAAPVTRLTEIFRQAAASKIVANAHRINQGGYPLMDNAADGDFFFIPVERGGDAAEQVESLVTGRIPRRYGLKPEEIQVLAPMYRGDAGVKALNGLLQNKLNPPGRMKKEQTLAGTLFREGDRVMQIKNEYDKEVFNGDIGRLVEIDPENKSLLVEVDGRGVTYDFNEADQLVLAYCSTIHKAQGSEYPCVVMVMLSEHQVMLARNLLYTGITRAQKLCVLVSNRGAVAAAVNNNRVLRRYSALTSRLRDAVFGEGGEE
jgi:exodeoxyribonuclease V alpha subunit